MVQALQLLGSHTSPESSVSVRRALKTVQAGQEFSYNFPTDICKFPAEKIIGPQKFNFAPKFSRHWVFSPTFCIFGRQFSDKYKIFRQPKI